MDIILTPTLTISHDHCFHRSANHLTHIPGWCPNMANFQKKIHWRSGLKDPLEQHLAGWDRLGTHRLNLFETNNLDTRSAYRSDATHKESAFGWTEVLRIMCGSQMLREKNDHSRGLVTISCPQSSQHIILTPLHQIIAIINKEANYPSTSPKMAGTSADFGDRLPRYPQGVSSQIGSNNTAKHLVLPAPVGPPSSYELNTW